MEADKIVVLENVTLIKEGTHFEFYEYQRRYFQMWQKQMPFAIAFINMREKFKDRKAFVVIAFSFILFSYWFSNWDAFEQFLKELFK